MIRHYVEHGMYLRQIEAPNLEGTIVYIHGSGTILGATGKAKLARASLRTFCKR